MSAPPTSGYELVWRGFLPASSVCLPPLVTRSAGRCRWVPRARRLLEEADRLRAQARDIASGLEAELTLVVEALFPMQRLVEALSEFSRRYPSVATRIYVEALGAATGLVLDGTSALGLLPAFYSETDALVRQPLFPVELVAVAAPRHALALIDGSIPPETLNAHVQLVLTDRSGLTGTRDYGVLASRTWRLGDLGAKHAMLRAGLGRHAAPHGRGRFGGRQTTADPPAGQPRAYSFADEHCLAGDASPRSGDAMGGRASGHRVEG